LDFLDRQIKHWTSNDLLRTVGSKHTGTGRSRSYSEEEIFSAAYLHELSKYGVTIGNLKRFRKNYDGWMKDSEYKDKLLGGTDKLGRHGYVVYYGISDNPNSSAGFAFISAKSLSDDDLWTIDHDGSTVESYNFQSALVINCRDLVARVKKR
jgi:hypothetical protein